MPIGMSFEDYKSFVQSVEKYLAPYATSSFEAIRLDGTKSIEIYNSIPPDEHQQARLRFRTPFQHDRDSILYSSFFAPLAQKTQLLTANASILRTRLTHTLIVNQMAISIARGLRLNEDLVEAIALGHDIGHTPFGHAGERGINRWLQKKVGRITTTLGLNSGRPGSPNLEKAFLISKKEDLTALLRNKDGREGLFMHGKQSFKKLVFFEELELTKQVLFGIWRHSRKPQVPDHQFEWEISFKDKIYSLSATCNTFEAEVVRIADDIAWVTHDIEDAIRVGIIKDEDVQNQAVADVGPNHVYVPDILGHRGAWINAFVFETIKHNLDKGLSKEALLKGEQRLDLSPPYEETLTRLRELVYKNILRNGEAKRADDAAEKVIEELCDHYHACKDAKDLIEDIKLIRNQRGGARKDFPFTDDKTLKNLWKEPHTGLAFICDFVSSLTDREALKLHEKYYSPIYQIRIPFL